MKIRLNTGIFCLIYLTHLTVGASPWDDFSTPYPAQPLAIGSYANGCLSGAQALPLQGKGFQVIRTSRNRYHGHPNLIEFIENFSFKTHANGLQDLLVGDMSMPRGGNFETGHASHQTGLDVDIWLRLADKAYSQPERENIKPLDVVDKKRFRINKQAWRDEHATVIRLAALDLRVARIFVNPVIKKQLCSMQWQDDSWLRKVRPWWGHSYHIHVRLACPEGEAFCKDQAEPPKGNGCNEVSWWKLRMVQVNSAKEKPKKPKKKVAKVKPKQCQPLLTKKTKKGSELIN